MSVAHRIQCTAIFTYNNGKILYYLHQLSQLCKHTVHMLYFLYMILFVITPQAIHIKELVLSGIGALG